MKRKIGISFTIDEDEFAIVAKRLIDDKLLNIDILYGCVKDDLNKNDLKSSIDSIKLLREKLYSFDFRLSEIGGMIEEYLVKKEKKDKVDPSE